MDHSFLKEQADRCRRLAENADKFTKRRLLDLAEKYDSRLGNPSRASRVLGIPGSLPEARRQRLPER
jgi:hypothetical protein